MRHMNVSPRMTRLGTESAFEVLARANREVVGRLYAERGVHFIVAENRRISQDFLVPADATGTTRERPRR